jgi:hypothetical protein
VTRGEWERELARLLAPVIAHASPHGARVRLPGPRPSSSGPESDSLEGFARSLWLAAPWLATHPTGVLDIAGRRVDLGAFYRRGFSAGTRRYRAESWYPLLRIPQTLVEAAAIARALIVARRRLWDPLNSGERRRLLAWLDRAQSRIPPIDNNWHLFSVTILTALKVLGGTADQDALDRHLDRIESFYLGDGWYTDGTGPPPVLDYYNATVFHPYLLWWASLDGDSRPERRHRVRRRASLFLERFPELFASNGSYPCFGRSATYRMALTHIVPWAVAEGVWPHPPGMARRLCGLAARRFLGDPEAVAPTGALSLGFSRAWPPLAESYSGPASPLWAGKAFAVLALPPDHEFWTAPEAPLPIEHEDYVSKVGAGCFLLSGDRRTGHVQLVNGGSVAAGPDYAPKYSRLTYSSHFGYEIERGRPSDEPEPSGDAALTLSLDGRAWYARARARPLQSDDRVLITEGIHPLPGLPARVVSAIGFDGDRQVRAHRVETQLPVFVREGSFALSWGGEEEPRTACGCVSWAAADGRASGIRPLLGYDAVPLPAPGNANILHGRSLVPRVETTRPRRGSSILASISLARPGHFEPAELQKPTPLLRRLEDALGMYAAGPGT